YDSSVPYDSEVRSRPQQRTPVNFGIGTLASGPVLALSCQQMSKLCDMSGLRSAAQLTHATIGVIFGREFGVKQACGRSDSAGLKAGALRCTHRSARKGFWHNVAGARKMLIVACVAVAGATAAASFAMAQGAVNPDEAR